jgi:hypothetical protein
VPVDRRRARHEAAERKWDAPLKELQTKLQLLIDATRVIEKAERVGYESFQMPLIQWLPMHLDGTCPAPDEGAAPARQRGVEVDAGR